MASGSAIYRKKLKEENPEKYQEYLQKQRTAGKTRREAQKKEPLTRAKELQLEERRKKHRDAQARYIEKKSGHLVLRRKRQEVHNGHCSGKRPKDMTPDERRLHTNRLRAESRSRQSAQKKRRIREKAREHMHQKRAQGRLQTHPQASSTLLSLQSATPTTPQPATPTTPQPPIPTPQHSQSSPPVSPQPGTSAATPHSPQTQYKAKTLYNLKHKIKKLLRLPTPNDSARILEGLAKSKTPEFKAAVRRRNFLRSPQKAKGRPKACKKLLNDSPGKKTSAMRRVASSLLEKARRLKRGRKDKESETDRRVKAFYLRFDIARPLPHQRYATKHGPGYVMNLTLRGAWRQFQAEEPQLKVGYTKFTLLRPKNVRKPGSVPAETCLCVYCLNIKYKLDALNRLLSKRALPPLPPESKLMEIVCCPTDSLPKADCIFGKCERCKDSLYEIRRRTVDIKQDPVNWTRWMRGQASNKLDVFVKSGSVEDLLQCLQHDVDKLTKTSTFREHIFTAHWQYKAARDLKFSLQQDEAMLIMDFAENRKACFNAEVKSAHFGKAQITLHPIVAYRKNSRGQLLHHSLMYLSDDIRHDFHAVNYFTAHALEHLKGLATLKRVILFSDGCASQYKGKGTFADLSLMHGLAVERSFYGSEHGKGEADGETGILSQMLKRAVHGGQTNIRHAKDLYDWAVIHMAKSTDLDTRLFFLVDGNAIQRDRPHTSVATLSGTRSYHQIQRVADYVLKCRRLSCFCNACRVDRPELCINAEYVGEWTEHKLKRTQEDLNNAFMEDDKGGRDYGGGEKEIMQNGHEERVQEVLNEAFIAEAEDITDRNQTDRQDMVSNPETSKAKNSTDIPSIGTFLTVTHRTLRGTQQSFKCLVVPSDLVTREGDFAVQYFKPVGQNTSMHMLSSDCTYVINLQDTNVETVEVLAAPSITPRGHYIF